MKLGGYRTDRHWSHRMRFSRGGGGAMSTATGMTTRDVRAPCAPSPSDAIVRSMVPRAGPAYPSPDGVTRR